MVATSRPLAANMRPTVMPISLADFPVSPSKQAKPTHDERNMEVRQVVF
jgi:hypothetical protein